MALKTADQRAKKRAEKQRAEARKQQALAVRATEKMLKVLAGYENASRVPVTLPDGRVLLTNPARQTTQEIDSPALRSQGVHAVGMLTGEALQQWAGYFVKTERAGAEFKKQASENLTQEGAEKLGNTLEVDIPAAVTAEGLLARFSEQAKGAGDLLRMGMETPWVMCEYVNFGLFVEVDPTYTGGATMHLQWLERVPPFARYWLGRSLLTSILFQGVLRQWPEGDAREGYPDPSRWLEAILGRDMWTAELTWMLACDHHGLSEATALIDNIREVVGGDRHGSVEAAYESLTASALDWIYRSEEDFNARMVARMRLEPDALTEGRALVRQVWDQLTQSWEASPALALLRNALLRSAGNKGLACLEDTFGILKRMYPDDPKGWYQDTCVKGREAHMGWLTIADMVLEGSSLGTRLTESEEEAEQGKALTGEEASRKEGLHRFLTAVPLHDAEEGEATLHPRLLERLADMAAAVKEASRAVRLAAQGEDGANEALSAMLINAAMEREGCNPLLHLFCGHTGHKHYPTVHSQEVALPYPCAETFTQRITFAETELVVAIQPSHSAKLISTTFGAAGGIGREHFVVLPYEDVPHWKNALATNNALKHQFEVQLPWYSVALAEGVYPAEYDLKEFMPHLEIVFAILHHADFERPYASEQARNEALDDAAKDKCRTSARRSDAENGIVRIPLRLVSAVRVAAYESAQELAEHAQQEASEEP